MLHGIRRRFTRMSISAKLVSIIMAISLAALALGAALTFIIRVEVLLDSQTSRMGLVADMSVDYVYAPMHFAQVDATVERLRYLRRVPEIAAAVLLDKNDVEFARWGRDPSVFARLPLDKPLPISLLNEHFSVSRPVNSPDGSVALGRLFILAETRQLRQQVFEYLLAMVTVAFAVTVLAIVLAMRLQRAISGPIKALAQVTTHISNHADYSLRVEPRTEDEIAQLYTAFNTLLQRVQDREAETVRVNKELQRSHDELDRRVQERTVQLKEANILLSRSLEDKETLLREVHHRVKNNLNVITSLLSLQSGDHNGLVDVSILRDAQQRIKTMSLVHETLYSAENFGELAAHEFIDRVVESLKDMYRIRQRGIVLRIDTADIELDVVQAIPIGLIVNELVTNAFKYAFVGRAGGIVEVSLSETPDGGLMLSVSDDGVGIANPAALDRSPTLGIRLVKALVGQIRGQLNISVEAGATFEVVFHRKYHSRGAREKIGRRSTARLP